ncbi:MAG TPA: cysteine--tRNA ligase [Solirubrobacteraceae bacterium]|nr:cysteine--tRNA ligase [Solirubrobacteraceae bacterium]
MRTIRLHDTRTGAVRGLETREPGRVGIYACGPTVYGRIHVGNARPYVVFSLLKRFLAHEGYGVRFVANITDINDKIYAAADSEGIGSAQLAREMAAAYRADTDRLGLGRPDAEPLASQSIPGIIGLIDRLIERGHAYPADGDVYFSVRSYPEYGKLSHRNVDDMDQGEGLEGGARKRDPLDFALWKAEKPGEDTAWDAPWGRGRPGWHIECSAMAEQLLGLDFEIHGGGSDLVFPHHENEAAQTAAARGRPLARLWVHNGMVRMDREKMAKSVGNIHLLGQALDRYGRDPLIMLFCSGHYRQPIEFDAERLAEAQARVDRIREAGRRLAPAPSPDWSGPLKERFFAALGEDFNTPGALAVVFEWVREANRAESGTGGEDLREMLEVLALENLLDSGQEAEAPAAVRALAGERESARERRDFAAADHLRDELRAAGWEVRDGPAGPELRPVG